MSLKCRGTRGRPALLPKPATFSARGRVGMGARFSSKDACYTSRQSDHGFHHGGDCFIAQ